MNCDIMNKAILNVAVIAVFAAVFCIVGCYDLGIEPSVKPPTVETFVDKRDGHVYKKVKIGEQVWMAENLKFAADGSVCYDDGYGAWHRDPEQFCEAYGRLYDWNTAMNGEHSSNAVPSGVEGVCPVDWHVPSEAEWQKLIDYVGEHAGTKLKSETFHGTQPGSVRTPEGTDIYNFSALPGGVGNLNDDGSGYFFHQGSVGYWWTSTEVAHGNNEAWFRRLIGSSSDVWHSQFEKHHMMSVRCVHD